MTLLAVSVWTKREFPSYLRNVMDKLVINQKDDLPTTYPHVSPFDHTTPH